MLLAGCSLVALKRINSLLFPKTVACAMIVVLAASLGDVHHCLIIGMHGVKPGGAVRGKVKDPSARVHTGESAAEHCWLSADTNKCCSCFAANLTCSAFNRLVVEKAFDLGIENQTYGCTRRNEPNNTLAPSIGCQRERGRDKNKYTHRHLDHGGFGKEHIHWECIVVESFPVSSPLHEKPQSFQRRENCVEHFERVWYWRCWPL